MLHPSYTDLMKVVNSGVEIGEEPVVNSRYSIVIATAKRARQLISGDEPLVEGAAGKKAFSVAVDELYKGKVTILSEEAVDEEDVEEVLYNYNNNDYFDISVISYVWNDAYDVATNYVDECCNIESWLTSYIDYEGLGEAMIENGYYYELYDGRVVEYNY